MKGGRGMEERPCGGDLVHKSAPLTLGRRFYGQGCVFLSCAPHVTSTSGRNPRSRCDPPNGNASRQVRIREALQAGPLRIN